MNTFPTTAYTPRRFDYTHLSTDALSLREVCKHLRIRRSQATRWIEMGLLKAVRRESRTGVVSYLIEFDALRKFCKEHSQLARYAPVIAEPDPVP